MNAQTNNENRQKYSNDPKSRHPNPKTLKYLTVMSSNYFNDKMAQLSDHSVKKFPKARLLVQFFYNCLNA